MYSKQQINNYNGNSIYCQPQYNYPMCAVGANVVQNPGAKQLELKKKRRSQFIKQFQQKWSVTITNITYQIQNFCCFNLFSSRNCKYVQQNMWQSKAVEKFWRQTAVWWHDLFFILTMYTWYKNLTMLALPLDPNPRGKWLLGSKSQGPKMTPRIRNFIHCFHQQ